MDERVRRRLELRRCNAAVPHSNKRLEAKRPGKGNRSDWKGLVEDYGYSEDSVSGFDIEQKERTMVCMTDGEVWPVGEIVVQREGSSQRTVEELLVQFVRDALDIAIADCGTVAGTDFATVEALESLVSEALDSTESLDALDDIVNEVESRLSDMGYVVDWNDGYVIYSA